MAETTSLEESLIKLFIAGEYLIVQKSLKMDYMKVNSIMYLEFCADKHWVHHTNASVLFFPVFLKIYLGLIS